MSDELDQAEELIELRVEVAIDRVRAQVNGPAAAVDECTECGEPIPEQRRVAVPTATLCVGCQSMLELQTRDRRDWW